MNEVISGLQGAKEYNGKRGKVVVREIKSAAQSLRLYHGIYPRRVLGSFEI